jgi:transcription elongation factor GreA
MPEYQLTQTKKEELEVELVDRKNNRRPAILEKLVAARELGDLKENAEYHTMRDEQGRNESRIREIEELLKFATVVQTSDSGQIDLASSVTLQKKGDTESRVYMIVGPAESNLAEGKIASTSPLGQALLGKSVGDIATVISPKGEIEYEIVSIA